MRISIQTYPAPQTQTFPQPQVVHLPRLRVRLDALAPSGGGCKTTFIL